MDKVKIFILLVLCLYGCDSEEIDSYVSEIEQCKEYFIDYCGNIDDFELSGLHPGAFTPLWEDATVFENSGYKIFNIPIDAEATYEGSLYDEDGIYKTVFLQKLIIVNSLGTQKWSSYIVTIIPSKEDATQRFSKLEENVYSGDPNSKFSGYLIYSTAITNYTISIEYYSKGELIRILSIYDTSIDNIFDEMNNSLPFKTLYRKVRMVSRSGDEWGGMGGVVLPEIVVPGNKPQNPDVPSLPNPPVNPGGSGLPNDPTPNYPPTTPPPPTGGGNNGGSSNNSKPSDYKESETDILFKKSFPIKMDRQLKNNCVPAIMEYLYNSVFEGKIDYEELEIKHFELFYKLPMTSGVDLPNVNLYMEQFFDIENCSNIIKSIDDGYPVMTSIKMSETVLHNVLIVGYRKDGNYIFMDPIEGKLKTSSSNWFDYSYIISVKSKK